MSCITRYARDSRALLVYGRSLLIYGRFLLSSNADSLLGILEFRVRGTKTTPRVTFSTGNFLVFFVVWD